MCKKLNLPARMSITQCRLRTGFTEVGEGYRNEMGNRRMVSIVLRRPPDGEESTQRLGARFPASKVTVFDVPTGLLPAQNDFEQLLAA
jgi:hypothetical protein